MLDPNNSNITEIVLDESSKENYTTNLNPILALPPSSQEPEKELQARELAKVIRRMHTADQRFREESEFLLLRNEVALHTLFQDNLEPTISQHESHHFQAEGDAEGWEAESPCFQEKKANEGEPRIATVNNEVEHNQTTPQSLDVQIIEDRIDKARLDLSFLEQQTTQMEIEMKTLQMELTKLKDQLCQTHI